MISSRPRPESLMEYRSQVGIKKELGVGITYDYYLSRTVFYYFAEILQRADEPESV